MVQEYRVLFHNMPTERCLIKRIFYCNKCAFEYGEKETQSGGSYEIVSPNKIVYPGPDYKPCQKHAPILFTC